MTYAKCGNCGEQTVRERSGKKTDDTDSPTWRVAECSNCGAVGLVKWPHQWKGIVNEAANLRYSRGKL